MTRLRPLCLLRLGLVRVLLAGVVGSCAMPAARATPPGAFYQDQTLLCRDPASGATAALWLDRDGRYSAFLAGATPIPGPGGIAYRAEGRRGSYGATPIAGGIVLCLRPDAQTPPRPASTRMLPFADAGCLTLPVHPIGETFTLVVAGRTLNLVLAQGR